MVKNQVFVLSEIRRLVHVVPRAEYVVMAYRGGYVAPCYGVIVAGLEVGVIVVAVENGNVQSVFWRYFKMDFTVYVVEREFAVDVECIHYPSEYRFADVCRGGYLVFADWNVHAGGECQGRYFAADAKFAEASVLGPDVGDGRQPAAVFERKIGGVNFQ